MSKKNLQYVYTMILQCFEAAGDTEGGHHKNTYT